jgi:TM2 domain-containing membrane protein YozV
MNETRKSDEKKLTLLLLCWLVGLFGVHRFYTGKYLSGGLQVFTLGLAGLLIYSEARPQMAFPVLTSLLWWGIDGLLIIMGKFTDREGRPIIDWI